MKINWAAASARTQELFYQTLRIAFDVVTKVLLPHLLGGFGLFALTCFATWRVFIAPLGLPSVLGILLGTSVFAVYGVVIFLYAVFTASIFSVYAASVRVEDFLEEVFSLIKANVESKISNMDEGLAKEQAKVIMKNSVSEVYALFKTYKLKSFPAFFAWVLLGVFTFVTKTVFISRIVRASGQMVKMSAIFAGKATLVGAIFLNLRFFSVLALVLLYAMGAALAGLDFVFLFK